MSADSQQPFDIGQLQANMRRNPGKAHAFLPALVDEPEFTPDNKSLADYIKQNLPAYKLIGPMRKHKPFQDAGPEYCTTFIEGDFNGNGLSDYLAVMGIEHEASHAHVVLFLQNERNEFQHRILQVWTTWYHAYLRKTTVGEIKSRTKPNHEKNQSQWKETFDIPADRPGAWIGLLARHEWGFYISSKGPRIVKFGC